MTQETVKSDTTFFKVDDAWGNLAPGTVIPDTGNLYYYGQNAFSAVADAFAALTDDTQQIEVVGDNVELAPDGTKTTYGDADLIIKDGAKAFWNSNSEVFWGNDETDNATFKIQAGGTLDTQITSDQMGIVFQGETRLALNGTTASAATINGNDALTIVLTDSSSLYAKNATVANLYGMYVEDDATVSLSNTTWSVDTTLDMMASGASMRLVNSTFTTSNAHYAALYGSIEVLNNSTFSLGTATGSNTVNYGDITVDAGTFEVKNANALFLNRGSITATDATLTVESTFGNAGGALSLTETNATFQAQFVNDGGTIEATYSTILSEGSVAGTQVFTNTDEGSISIDHNSALIVLGVRQMNGVTWMAYNSAAAINEGTLNIANSSYDNAPAPTNGGFYVLGNFENAGTMTVDDASTVQVLKKTTLKIMGSSIDFGLIEGQTSAFTNTGTLNIALNEAKAEDAATITVNNFLGSTGSIVVDMEGATGFKYKLIDADNVATNLYGKVSFLDHAQYTSTVIDGDLWAYQTSNIIVDYTGTLNPDGKYIAGVNYFNTLAEASDATSQGSRTYELTFTENAYMTFWTSVDSDFAEVTIKDGNKKIASFLVGGDTAKKVALEGNKTYTIEFVGDNADYDFDAYFHTTPKNTDKDIGTFGVESSGTNCTGWQKVAGSRNVYVYNCALDDDDDAYAPAGADGYDFVGFDTKAQVYTFTIGNTDSGRFTFDFAMYDDPSNTYTEANRFTYTLVNQDGKVLIDNSTDDEATHILNLTAGVYTVTVDTLDNCAGDYNAEYTLKITGEFNEDVVNTDNTIDGTGVQTLVAYNATPDSIVDFVGLGDSTDYYKLNLAASDSDPTQTSGTYTLTWTAVEGTSASGVYVELIRKDGSKETVLSKQTYYGDPLVFNQVTLDGTKEYYAKVVSPIRETSTRNATYTITFKRETENGYISSADDTRILVDKAGAATWIDASTIDPANEYENWVGTEDTCDWIRLTNITEGDNTFEIRADGDTIYAEIHAAKIDPVSGSSEFNYAGTLETLQCKDGATSKVTIECSSDYDYYVRFKAQDGATRNTYYTLSIDPA